MKPNSQVKRPVSIGKCAEGSEQAPTAVTTLKRPKLEFTLQQLSDEIYAAAAEGRQFSVSGAVRQHLVQVYGMEKVRDVIFEAIRATQTPLVDPFDMTKDLQKWIRSVNLEAAVSIMSKQEAWSPKGTTTTYETGEGILLTCSTNTSELSNHLSSDVRYNQQISTKISAVSAWNDDVNLKKIIFGNLERKDNQNSAISRNGLKTSCLLYGKCEYPTPFPISAVIWILKREAARRPEKKLLRYIDPCAGWGDRVAGAILCGPDVLEHYVGIDPWEVSQNLCQRITEKLSPPIGERRVEVSLLQKGAEDQSEPWPDADLVFTSPPYAKKECYNLTSNDFQDGQAWRLCDFGKFASHFLEPMMQNAARATKARSGRVIINVSNTEKKYGGVTLLDDVITAAEKAGLRLVEIFGIRAGTRSYNNTKTEKVARGDPCLVFEH